jgi:hypothetical protein
MDFTQNQTLTGEQFFLAWEESQKAAQAYADARYFVPVSDHKIVDHLVKYSRFLVFPYALSRSEDWPFEHIRMEKREFRKWLKDCQIHTFCFYWESNRMMVITEFSADGVAFWDYQYDNIVRVKKRANKQDFNR